MLQMWTSMRFHSYALSLITALMLLVSNLTPSRASQAATEIAQLNNTPTWVEPMTQPVTNVASGEILNNVTRIWGGPRITCAEISGATLKCWGDNNTGALGNNRSTREPYPVAVVDLPKAVNVAPGVTHTCAIADVGNNQSVVKCWGFGAFGALGDGKTLSHVTPVTATVPGNRFIAIATGNLHSCAVNEAGELYCWGHNDFNQVAEITATVIPTPTRVNLPGQVQQVAAGTYSTCAYVVNPASVYCWGRNHKGQLGRDTITQKEAIPAPIRNITGEIIQLVAGGEHACLIRSSNNSLWCWGSNRLGEIGNLSLEYEAPDPREVGLASKVHAGFFHTCGLMLDTQTWKCWGWNARGQLGAGFTSPYITSPTPVQGLSDLPVDVVAGETHSCALLKNGTVQCWGSTEYEQLGLGTLYDTFRLQPAGVEGLISDTLTVSGNPWADCALRRSGQLVCWGWTSGSSYEYDALGTGIPRNVLTPKPVLNLPAPVIANDLGAYHSCMVVSTGTVLCVGDNTYGQLGTGDKTGHSQPITVTGLTSGFIAVGTGENHSCALNVAGEVWCWGDNSDGQTGQSPSSPNLVPVKVPNLPNTIVQLAVGRKHTCAKSSNSDAYCWGWNDYGQVGDLTTSASRPPTKINLLLGAVLDLTAGYGHTCATVLRDPIFMRTQQPDRELAPRVVKCWGLNDFGQLGIGSQQNVLTPTQVLIDPRFTVVYKISAARAHTCAIVDNVGTTDSHVGRLQCWGQNRSGELGDGTRIMRLAPTDVFGLESDVVDVTAEGWTTDPTSAHTCAVTSSGQTRCWGSNVDGRLGNTKGLLQLAPAFVLAQAAPAPAKLSVTTSVTPTIASPSAVVTYTVQLSVTGNIVTATLKSTIPAGITYLPGTLQGPGTVVNGSVTYVGPVTPTQTITLTYSAIITSSVAPGAILPSQALATDGTSVAVDGNQVVVPDPNFTGDLVLVYVALDTSDTKVQGQAKDLFNQVSNASKSADRKVVMLFDAAKSPRYPLTSSITSTIYLYNPVVPGGDCDPGWDPLCNNRYLFGQGFEQWPDDNSASRENLTNFLLSGMRTYTNTRRVLVSLVGHGDGFTPDIKLLGDQPGGDKCCKPQGITQTLLGGFLYDENIGPAGSGRPTWMTTHEFGEAFKIVTKDTQRKIDLLYLDACLMGAVEVIYELRDSVKYVLASPAIKWTTFPYDKLLQETSNITDTSALGKKWLDIEVKEAMNYTYPVVFGLYDVAKAEQLRGATDVLANTLQKVIADPDSRNLIEQAKKEGQCYDTSTDITDKSGNPSCDLKKLVLLLKMKFAVSSPVHAAAEGVLSALAQVVIASDRKDGQYQDRVGAPIIHWPADLGGLSIFAPFGTDHWKRRYYSNEKQIAWAQFGNWDSALDSYWQGTESPCVPGYLCKRVHLPLLMK